MRVTLRFRPAGAETSEGLVALAPALPTLRLRGKGVEGAIRCTGTVDFGTRVKGTTYGEVVQCTNAGAVERLLQAGPVGGANAADFTLAGSTTVRLAPDGATTFPVIFAARGEAGARVGSQPVAVDGRRVANALLSGGTVPHALVFPSLTEGCTDFGFTAVGSRREFAIGVENVSDGPVTTGGRTADRRPARRRRQGLPRRAARARAWWRAEPAGDPPRRGERAWRSRWWCRSARSRRPTRSPSIATSLRSGRSTCCS